MIILGINYTCTYPHTLLLSYNGIVCEDMYVSTFFYWEFEDEILENSYILSYGHVFEDYGGCTKIKTEGCNLSSELSDGKNYTHELSCYDVIYLLSNG